MKLNLRPNEIAEALDIYVRTLFNNIDDDVKLNIVFDGKNATAYIGEQPEGETEEEAPAPPKKKAARRRQPAKKEPVTKTEEVVTKEPMEEPDPDPEEEEVVESEEPEQEPEVEDDEDEDEGEAKKTVADMINQMEGKSSPKKSRKKNSIFSKN